MTTIDEDLIAAWQRVLSDRALAGDGEMVLMWLRRVQMRVTPAGLQSCAVHDFEGQRRLAATILGFAVTPEHDRSSSSERNAARADLDIERRSRDSRVVASRQRGAGRRVGS
jgi:hypothetical protein